MLQFVGKGSICCGAHTELGGVVRSIQSRGLEQPPPHTPSASQQMGQFPADRHVWFARVIKNGLVQKHDEFSRNDDSIKFWRALRALCRTTKCVSASGLFIQSRDSEPPLKVVSPKATWLVNGHGALIHRPFTLNPNPS